MQTLTRSKLITAVEAGIQRAGITGGPALLLRQVAAGTQRVAVGSFTYHTDDGGLCGCPLTQARLYVDGSYIGIDSDQGNAFYGAFDPALDSGVNVIVEA